MSKISTNRILFTCIFACLMGVDAVVGSQSEYIFQFTNNLVGIVFSIVILTTYPLKEFLNPFYALWTVLGIVITISGYLFWLYNQEGHMFALWITVPLNIWILGMAVIKLLERILITKDVEFKASKTECFFMAGLLLMTLSLNEAFWPLYYMVIFTTFRHTEFPPKDKNIIFHVFLDGIILGFVFVQGFAFYNRPYDAVRYAGAYGDCNRNACMYMVTIIALLSKGFLCKGSKIKRPIYYILASAVFSFLLFTGCRSAIIGLFFAVTIMLMAELKILREKIIVILLRFAGCIILSFFLIPFVYALIRYIPAVCDHPLYYNSWSENRVQPRSPINDERYISMDQALDMIYDRFIFIDDASGVVYDLLNNDFANPFVMKVFAAESFGDTESSTYTIVFKSYDDPDSLMESFEMPEFLLTSIDSVNVRVGISAVLLKNLNLFGHKSYDGRYYIWICKGNSAFDTISYNPQNFLVYMLYIYGLVFGLFGIILYFVGLFIVLKNAFNGSYYSVVALMFYMIHFGMGITEAVWIPGQIILVALFFMITLVMDEKVRNT